MYITPTNFLVIKNKYIKFINMEMQNKTQDQ